MKPIIVFKNEKELIQRGKYWQEVLGLSDWLIKFMLVSKDKFNAENDDRAGENTTQYVNKVSVIRVLKNPPIEKFYFNQPQEQVLIHELLHSKFISVGNENNTIESVLYENYEHTLLEDLAKSLFWAKYNYTISDYYKEDKDK